MSQRKYGKCPKCGGDMKAGKTSGELRILKHGDLVGDRANAFYCQDCGFVELYKEPSAREPQRWHRPPQELKQAPPSEEPQETEQEEPKSRARKRLVR